MIATLVNCDGIFQDGPACMSCLCVCVCVCVFVCVCIYLARFPLHAANLFLYLDALTLCLHGMSRTNFCCSVQAKSSRVLNPLPTYLQNFLFLRTLPKIGSFRLPTHSRDAHKNFFEDLFLNWNENFGQTYHK